MAVRILILISMLIFVACADDDDGLGTPDGGTTDAGVVDVVDASVPDTGPTDAGPIDASAARTLVQRPLIPTEQRRNTTLLPDFEWRVINGGWFAVPADGSGQPQPWSQRYDADTPGTRPEVAIIPGTDVSPSGVNFAGFAMSTDGPLHAEVWLGVDTPTIGWAGISSGLLGYVDGMGTTVVMLNAEPATEVKIDGTTWRRYAVTGVENFVGRVTFIVQNLSADPVHVNAPFVGARTPFAGGRAVTYERPSASWRIDYDASSMR